ncbi:carboxypeptidase regulatory-like domain-containing protein [Bacillus marasmi]|uniref:carboxypeptidase regulatory-like domain-containing protein n=1 Tax=Bacillus marasmi TaxID=1926279 RepID=UPI0011C7A53A|nr:carboxypeptidase regulatory-like domain-containing protein [Bacillus marasmi]
MKKFNKMLFVLTFIFGFFLQQNYVAHAEELPTLKVETTTDKQEYTETDEIKYKLAISNTSEDSVVDVVVKSTLPEGLELVTQDLNVENNTITWNLDEIAPESETNLEFTAKIKTADAGEVTPPVNTEVKGDATPGAGSDKGKQEVKAGSNAAPQTGDDTNFLGYFLLLLVSMVVLVVAIRAIRQKRVPKELSYILIGGLLLSSFSAIANAEDRMVATAQNSHELTINDKKYVLKTTVEGVIESEHGTLIGNVVDAVSNTALNDASVKIYNESVLVKESVTKEDGSYEVRLKPGIYNVVVSHPNYITDSSYVSIDEANTTTFNAKLQMVGNEYSGIGTATGKVVNALTGDPVSRLKIDIRKGKNNVFGEIVETVTTNESGVYSVDLPGGNYTMHISGAGYISTSAYIISIGGQTKGNQDATISPDGLLGEEIRAVLTWGESPEDLDSHFTGPTADGGRFHVYFSKKSYSDEENEVNLDIDDTTSYGPETVTVINRINEGTYTYAIHDYTNRYDENLALSNSEATVRIYKGNSLVATYNVPLDQEGNVWRVFEIRNGDIVPINRIDTIDDWHNDDNFLPEE